MKTHINFCTQKIPWNCVRESLMRHCPHNHMGESREIPLDDGITPARYLIDTLPAQRSLTPAKTNTTVTIHKGKRSCFD
jgi:hypothetical protein